MRKLLRRIPFLRWCALQHLNQIRERLAEARQRHLDSVVQLVGEITMSWSMIERFLDELIAFYQIVATDLQKEHPRSLSSKLKYLRLMQCDKRFPDGVREFLRTARIETKRLGDRRHEMIHGLLWRRATRPAQWQIQRIRYDGPFARLELKPTTDEDLRQLLRDISNLAADLSPKVWVITRGNEKGFPPSHLEKARRELGMAD